MIEVTMDIKAVSVANVRMHWAAKAKMVKAQRSKAKLALQQAAPISPDLPVTVVITRIGPRTLDTDNLASSLKAVRDGIADWLGVDDGHKDIDWQYRQRKGIYSVEVEVI